MDGLFEFFFILIYRIVLVMLGSWILRVFFNVPYKKASKKKSDNWYGDIIDVEEYKDRLVGFGAVMIFGFLAMLIF